MSEACQFLWQIFGCVSQNKRAFFTKNHEWVSGVWWVFVVPQPDWKVDPPGAKHFDLSCECVQEMNCCWFLHAFQNFKKIQCFKFLWSMPGKSNHCIWTNPSLVELASLALPFLKNICSLSNIFEHQKANTSARSSQTKKHWLQLMNKQRKTTQEASARTGRRARKRERKMGKKWEKKKNEKVRDWQAC